MIKDIQELNFPSYATLTRATVTLQDMAEKTITSQIKVDGAITPDFSYDWEVEFKGEKYIHPLRKPQAAKENTSLDSTIDLTFQHWAIYQLKRWMFFTVQPIESGTAVADKYIASVSLDLKDFCDLFGQVLEYYYGDSITIDLNPEWEYAAEPTTVEISYSYVWDVLIQFYELYAVRWQIEPKGDTDHYVIKVGYPTTEMSHIFEYGFDGGLLKVERQVQDENIRNMLLGRGGEKNLPYRYFKDVDPDNPSFAADPDWIPELRNIYFSELRPKTFRDYVKGWKTNPNRQLTETDGSPITPYPHDSTVSPIAVEPYDEAYAADNWAYKKGHEDDKFDPVEYVKDDSSISKYGPLLGGLENNEDIYPSIQGVEVSPFGRVDEAVDVEQIESDDVAATVESDAVVSNVDKDSTTVDLQGGERKTISRTGPVLPIIPTGKYGNLDIGPISIKASEDEIKVFTFHIGGGEVDGSVIQVEDASVTVVDLGSGEEHSASGIPAGSYRYVLKVSLYNTSEDKLTVTLSCENAKLTTASPGEQWGNTFDIWVKNIWGTQKGLDDDGKAISETTTQYAERVWGKILGDRTGSEAMVVFSSGMLSTSEDYEFVIVDIPVYDESKTFVKKDKNGNIIGTYASHWKIKLAKSDADLESLGLYVPSTMRQGSPGDYFFFVGIDMPHQYVLWAEERLDAYKTDELGEVSDIKPTWVVSLDKVRIGNEGKPDALIDQLQVGGSLRLADKRFITDGNADGNGTVYETLYLQSITYTYNEPSSDDVALMPDVEIVVGDKYETVANPVATLQGSVDAISKQIGSISNIEQIVRAVGDRLYLRKDGIADRSMSPTEFYSLLTSADFRSGLVGGQGWGLIRDANGNAVLEVDKVNVRQDMQVNNLAINQVEWVGGEKIESATGFEITRVVESGDGYVCYFDQKDGSVANLFEVGDIAYCNRLTPENADLKSYKRRVVEVGVDYITLTKGFDEEELPDGWTDSGVNGSGIPQEKDVVIQYGSYTDPSRRFVKVRNVIGGGYERYIEGLDSVNASGTEYYFVGRQTGMFDNLPRWYVGDPESNIEYKNRQFNLNNVVLSINSKIGDKTISEHLAGYTDSYDYLKAALKQNTTIAGGLIQSSVLALGYVDELGEFKIMAGSNGLYESDKTIASWWGGSMVDKQVEGNETAADAATALLRMDGSGYFANGNISWTVDGAGWVANKNISWDSLGNVTLGSGVKITIGDGSDVRLNEMITSFVQFANGVQTLFAPVNADGEELPWRDYAQAEYIKAKKTLFSIGDISAFGSGGDSSGGGDGGATTLGGLVNVDSTADDTSTTDVVLARAAGATHWTVRPLSEITGLDETALASYLAQHGYATQTWVDGRGYATTAALQELSGRLDSILGSDASGVIDKWDEIVAFLDTYTEADTLATLLSNKADKTVAINAGTGLTGGGTLAASRTLSLAASGVTAGTYFKTTVDAYGRVTAGSNPTTLAGYGITDAKISGGVITLGANTITPITTVYALTFAAGTFTAKTYTPNSAAATVNIPTTTSHISEGTNLYFTNARAQSALASTVTALNNAIALKLDESAFDDLFEKVNIGTTASPVYVIKTKYALYSVGEVSAFGSGGDSSGGGTAATFNRLDSWADYDTAKAGYALSAALGYGLYTKQNDLISRVATLEGKNYLDALTLTSTGTGNAVTAVALSSDKKTLTVTKGTTFLTAHQALDHIVSIDSRSTATLPNSFSASLRAAFKYNSTNGLSDGGTYNGVLFFRPYGAAGDMTGGYPHELAFTANGHMWHRIGTSATAWGDWNRVAFASDIPTSMAWSAITGKPTTLSGYGITDAVTLSTAQTISGLKTITAGLKVSGRVQGSGDDEGIVIGFASNNFAGLCLGEPLGERSVFYKIKGSAPFWRYNNGTSTLDVYHPAKAGTIALTSQLTDGSVTKVGTSSVGSGIKPVYLNAGTITASTSTVGSSTCPVYLNAGTITAVSGIAEGYLTLGGPCKAGTMGPAYHVRGVSDVNHFEAMRAADISVEQWDGTAWVDAGLTNRAKLYLMSEQEYALASKLTNGTAGDKIRVTITATAGYLYFRLTQLVIKFSSASSAGLNPKVKVEMAKIGSETTFTTIGTYSVGGDSGWNQIFLNHVFGGSADQTSNYRKLRLTFSTSAATSNTSAYMRVFNIQGYGVSQWAANSTYNKWNKPYLTDLETMKTTFVGSVASTSGFIGNADTATKLATARTLWGKSFDGSANVTGGITLTADSTCTGRLRFYHSSTGVLAGLIGDGVVQTAGDWSRVQFLSASNGSVNFQTNSNGERVDIYSFSAAGAVRDAMISLQGSFAVTDRYYLDSGKNKWLRYNYDTGVLETNCAIVSSGEVTAFGSVTQ